MRSRAAQPTSQQTRLRTEPALEVDAATAQVGTMGVVVAQRTTTAFQKQHKLRFDRPVMVPVNRRKEKAQIRDKRVYNKVL